MGAFSSVFFCYFPSFLGTFILSFLKALNPRMAKGGGTKGGI